MRKNVVYIIIYLLVTVLVSLGILLFMSKNKKIIVDTSKLDSITINGKTYKTTGAVPSEDKDKRELFQQKIQLTARSPIVTDQFKIISTNNGQITITLLPEYEVNKTQVIQWLKDNGFEKIKIEDIEFVNY